jgi:hypothetical protein
MQLVRLPVGLEADCSPGPPETSEALPATWFQQLLKPAVEDQVSSLRRITYRTVKLTLSICC